MANRAYLSLGSNIDKEQNLPAAVRLLSKYGQVTAISTVWETTPVGLTDQPNFLNAVILLETDLSPQELRFEAIAQIEHQLGRTRKGDDHGARRIDIDMMLFNQDILHIGNRQIPDPEIYERPFVAIPLAEIAPDYVHPITNQTLAEIARQFTPSPEEMIPRPDVDISPK